MEQTVSRAQLESPTSSPSASPDPEDIARIRSFATDIAYISKEVTPPLQDIRQNEDGDEPMDFQLFAPTSTTRSKDASKTVQKIRLRSHTPPDPDKAGFLEPNRPSKYYFASTIAEDTSVALSGQDVVKLSKTPCPGNAYPWKVLHLPPSGLSRGVKAEEATVFHKVLGKVRGKTCRPGKKIRIAMRIKAQTAKKVAEEKAKESEEKEAKEREKRAHRNREKKLKRREKERAKKAEARAKGDDVDNVDNVGEAESSDEG